VIFEREADRGQVAQGLMGPAEVVLHEPFRQALVEDRRISRHVSEADELLLSGLVEPLIHGVVLGCFDPGPVMLKVELLERCLEVAVKFASVVSLNILNLAVKHDIQAVEKIPGGRGAVCRIHLAKATLVCRSVAVRIYRFWPCQ
jgi:hypothetical protein